MSPIRMQRVESAMRVVLDFVEAFNCHDAAGLVALMNDACVYEAASPGPDGDEYSGRERVAQYFRGFFEEFPDARIEIEEIFGFGLRCVLRLRVEWTDASKTKKHDRMIDIFKVEHEKISAVHSYKKA